MIIYKVTNTINDKVYIGKTTKTLEKRKLQHLKNVRLGKVNNFYSAIRKYGIDVFIWVEIITGNTNNELNELEIFYINKFNSFKKGYNMTLGGDGGDTISNKSNIEKKNQGAKIGNIPWNKGVNMKKMGYLFDNRKPRRKFTDDEKIAHSIKIKNSKKYQIGLQSRIHGKSKKVLRCSDLKTWPTIKDCSIEINVTKSKVRRYIYAGKLINGDEFIFID